MRYLWLSLVVLLVACGSDDKESEPKSYALNGFWNGQLNQGTDMRLLVYNGEVFARDAEQGYYGTLTYSDFNLEVQLTLSAKDFAAQSDATTEAITTGASTDYHLEGIYYSAYSESELIGDYQAADAGSFDFNHEASWDSGSSLTALTGKWQAGETELRINPKNNRYQFRAVKTNGCTMHGELSLLNERYILYQVDMKVRRNCTRLNKPGQGYAALNEEGELEFYVRSGSSLLFMTFQSSTENQPPVEPNPEEGGGEQTGGETGEGNEPDEGVDGEGVDGEGSVGDPDAPGQGNGNPATQP